MTQTATHTLKVPNLRFPGFVGEWEEKKLGEVSSLTSSKRVYLSDYVKEGIPFYRGKEISEIKKNIIPKDILYISENAYEIFKAKYGIPLIGDILITAVGTLGNTLRVTSNSKFYFKDGNLIWIKNITENPSFLEIILHTEKNKILNSAIGSSQKALTIVSLSKLKFLLPQLPEQQKIADFLSVVDEKISSLEDKKSSLQEYKNGMMQKIFSQEVRFTGDNGESFGDWEEKRLGEICEVTTGKSKSSHIDTEGGNVIVDMGAIGANGKIIKTKRTKFNGDFLDSNNLVMAKDDIGGGNIIGKVVQVPSNQNFVLGDHVYKLIVNEGLSIFLFYIINSFKINKSFRQKANGTAQIGITNGTVKNQLIPFPSLPEQQKIADFLSDLDEKIEILESEIEIAKEWKKGLLQNMFV